MKEQGQNEKTRLVEISDPSAKNLDQAFQKMWEVAGCTSCTKPLHHISINPMKNERLTDKQVLAIVERCEEQYGYKIFHHQRVIVEHVKDGRQHFHVIWNRVSLMSGSAVWPGHHWLKSKEVCRKMERELGLQSPTPRQHNKPRGASGGGKQRQRPTATGGRPGRSRTPVTTTPRRMFGSPIRFTGSSRPTSRGSLPSGAKAPATPKLPMPRIVTPKTERPSFSPMPMRPQAQAGGWPTAAILDWKTWGKKDPRAFFRKWPELAS
jgi:hypothetical protein